MSVNIKVQLLQETNLGWHLQNPVNNPSQSTNGIAYLYFLGRKLCILSFSHWLKKLEGLFFTECWFNLPRVSLDSKCLRQCKQISPSTRFSFKHKTNIFSWTIHERTLVTPIWRHITIPCFCKYRQTGVSWTVTHLLLVKDSNNAETCYVQICSV